MQSKPFVAILTSSTGGLSHFCTHLYGPLKEYCHPYYVTYSDAVIDDLVKEYVDKPRQLLKNQSASSILLTLKFFQEKKIDFINFHIATTARKMFLYYVTLLSQAKLKGIKIIGTIHDVMPFETFYIDPAALELLYSCVDHYIVGNESELNRLQLYFNVPSKKIDIIEHGPYLLFDNRKYCRESAREKLGIKKNKKVILFFGLLRPHKGLKFLLKAFKKVIHEIPDALLYISSDLSYSPELNELLTRIERSGVADSIKLSKGYAPSSEIEVLFKAADVVALPYTQVSQSGVLNLAYAFKKPVVVTDIFSDANAIDRKFGRVAKTEDVDSLTKCLLDLLNQSEKELADLGKAGYDYSVHNNDWSKSAKTMSKLFTK